MLKTISKMAADQQDVVDLFLNMTVTSMGSHCERLVAALSRPPQESICPTARMEPTKIDNLKTLALECMVSIVRACAGWTKWTTVRAKLHEEEGAVPHADSDAQAAPSPGAKSPNQAQGKLGEDDEAAKFEDRWAEKKTIEEGLAVFDTGAAKASSFLPPMA